MEAPQEIKKREYCKNAPGTSQAAGIYAAILSRERVSLGHAYADKGVDYFMDAIEQAMKEHPGFTLEYIRSRRFSSDHCGFYPRPDQIPRMAKLGYYISCGGNVLDRSYPWLKLYGLQKYEEGIAPLKNLGDGGGGGGGGLGEGGRNSGHKGQDLLKGCGPPDSPKDPRRGDGGPKSGRGS